MSMNSASQLPAVAAQAVLAVVDGVHQGVSLPLERNVYSIGSEPSVDIMLADTGVAPEHGIVRLHGGTVIVEAAGGDIGLGKRHRIVRGHGCRTTLPVELKLGTAVLRIERPRTRRSWLNGKAVPRLAAIGAIGCVVLIPLSGFDTRAAISRMSLSSLASTSAAIAPGATAPASPSYTLASDNAPAAVPPAAASRAPRAATASVNIARGIAEIVNEKLAEAGLTSLVTKVDGTRLVVSGAILHEQSGSWSEIQRWFDLTYGGRYILASTVETRSPDGNPKFDLQAISFGEPPYVITTDGQRRYPGAVLDKGWIIKEIGARRLTLTKDGKELALSF
jgi:hypothetical protein